MSELLLNFNNPLIQARGLEAMWLETCSYEEFATSVNQTIDSACYLLIEDSEKHLNLKETEITSSIWMFLKGQRLYHIEKDSDSNGNVDLIVRSHKHKLLVEAKIWSSNSYLYQGYLQLTERYSKGEKQHNQGAILIYIKPDSEQNNEVAIMEEWSSYLKEKYEDININPCVIDDSRFKSSRPHSGTKHDYHVRHIPITFMHIPRDKSGMSAEKYVEIRKAYDEKTQRN